MAGRRVNEGCMSCSCGYIITAVVTSLQQSSDGIVISNSRAQCEQLLMQALFV